MVVRQPSRTKECSKPREYTKCTPSKCQTVLQAAVAAGVQHGYMGGDIPEWEVPHLPCSGALLTKHASCTLFFESHYLFEEKIVRSNIRIFERILYSKSFTAPLPTGCSNEASAVGVRWKLQLPSRGIETTVTARSLLNDLLSKPARALTVLGTL